MVYFTMRFGRGRNRLYYSYVDDAFTKLETKPELLFAYPKDISYIDGDITQVGDRFHLFYVAHDGTPGIKQAVSDSLTSGYVYDPAWCDSEPKACEAPNVWKRIGQNKWVLMDDIYGIDPHNFGFSETTDFKTFTNLGRFNERVMKTVGFTTGPSTAPSSRSPRQKPASSPTIGGSRLFNPPLYGRSSLSLPRRTSRRLRLRRRHSSARLQSCVQRFLAADPEIHLFRKATSTIGIARISFKRHSPRLFVAVMNARNFTKSLEWREHWKN